MSDLIHACTVNGHDAQYWYEQAEAWKAKAGSAGSDGEHRERRRWQKATGFEFAGWYERAHPRTPPGHPEHSPKED